MREPDVPLFSLESCSAGARLRPRRHHASLRADATPTSSRRSTSRASRCARPIGARTTRSSSAAGRASSTPSRSRRSSTRSSSARARRRVAEIVARAPRGQGARAARAPRRSCALAQVPGVYVPSLYESSDGSEGASAGVDAARGRARRRRQARRGRPRRRVAADLRRRPVHGRRPRPLRHRGAARLHARMPLLPGGDGLPARCASAPPTTIVRDVIAGLACTGYDEVSLTSLSTTDHSQLEEVLRRLQRRLEGTGVSVSLPSLRVDAFGVEMARLVSAGGKKSGLTFAPEAGTQRMRDVVNKNVTEEDLLGSVAAGVRGRMATREAVLHDRPSHRDRRRRPRHRRAGAQACFRTAREATPPDAARRGCVSPCRCRRSCPRRRRRSSGSRRSRFEEVRRRQARAARVDAAQGRRAALARLGRLVPRGRHGARRPRGRRRRSRRRGAAGARLRRVDRALPPRRRGSMRSPTNGVDPAAIANRERSDDEPLPWEHISAGVSTAATWPRSASARCRRA